jgi:hypothetical protein
VVGFHFCSKFLCLYIDLLPLSTRVGLEYNSPIIFINKITSFASLCRRGRGQSLINSAESLDAIGAGKACATQRIGIYIEAL